MSAKPRSLLKLDQAYIAVGGREHVTLDRETDIMRTIALRQSPTELQRCLVAHSLHPMYLPLGLVQMRIE